MKRDRVRRPQEQAALGAQRRPARRDLQELFAALVNEGGEGRLEDKKKL